MASAAQEGVDYLLDYTESIASLPAELQKTLALIGELDSKLTNTREALDERAAKLLRRSKRSRTTESQRQLWEQTAKEQQESIDISDEKVALAEQVYETVDGHIRRLDQTLEKFEAELRQTDPSRLADLKLAAVQPDPFGAAGISSGGRRRGGGGGGSSHAGGELQYADMPIDENEPRYCYCQKVSYGEMVACDNVDCPHEWFHYGCVGLTGQPAGDWLCPTCRDDPNVR